MTDIPKALLGRKAALIGLGAIASILVLLIGAAMAGTLYSQYEEKNSSLFQLSIYKGEEGSRSQLEEQLNSVLARGANTPGFVVSDNVALAQAKLEAEIKTLAEANACTIRSAQTGPVERKGILDLFSLQYELTVPITHLKPLLYALETHTPYIYIDQIDIAAPAGWQTAQSHMSEPTLEVHWTIHAYRWGRK